MQLVKLIYVSGKTRTLIFLNLYACLACAKSCLLSNFKGGLLECDKYTLQALPAPSSSMMVNGPKRFVCYVTLTREIILIWGKWCGFVQLLCFLLLSYFFILDTFPFGGSCFRGWWKGKETRKSKERNMNMNQNLFLFLLLFWVHFIYIWRFKRCYVTNCFSVTMSVFYDVVGSCMDCRFLILAFLYAGNRLVYVVLRVSFPGEKLGQGWKYDKGISYEKVWMIKHVSLGLMQAHYISLGCCGFLAARSWTA